MITVARGLRSSCDSVGHELALTIGGRFDRDSMAFMVLANLAISSSTGGTGTRRCRSLTEMSETSRRIDSTGRIARPARIQTRTAETTTRMGKTTARASSRSCTESSAWSLDDTA